MPVNTWLLLNSGTENADGSAALYCDHPNTVIRKAMDAAGAVTTARLLVDAVRTSVLKAR